MSILISTATDIIHFLKINVFLKDYLSFSKKEEKIRNILMLIFIGIMSLILKNVSNNIIEVILYIGTILTALIFLYTEKIVKTFAYGFWSIIISSLFDQMSVMIINVLFEIVKYSNDVLKNFFASMLSFVFIYLVGKIINNKGKSVDIGIIGILGFTVLAIADVVVLFFCEYQSTEILKETQRLAYEVAFILVVIGVFVQLGAVIILIVSRNEHKEKELMIQQYLNEQKGHYEYLEQKERETRKFRHDLKSHLHMINIFLNQKEYDMLDNYLKKTNVKVEEFTNKITVNNNIVDAIINKYYSEAEKDNVKMKVEGHFPVGCIVDAYDLCTIFSNLLSNALEAARKAAIKEINVSCKYVGEDIIIIISNYYSGNLKIKKGKLKTIKGNDRIHGFGLENVQECVEKNGGYTKIDRNENQFKVTVLLKNGREEKDEDSYSG